MQKGALPQYYGREYVLLILTYSDEIDIITSVVSGRVVAGNGNADQAKRRCADEGFTQRQEVMKKIVPRIIRVDELLREELQIPPYQRPYRWTRKNVAALLNDIDNAIADSKRPDYKEFRYRIGTVIVHKKDADGRKMDIVDGQQRLITLSLLMLALDDFPYAKECYPLVRFSACGDQDADHYRFDKDSRINIADNYRFIREWKSVNEGKIADFRNAFGEILEAVLIEVDDISEAFQLFDSQNTRGRELDPHDLLKAYHLRKMNEYSFEKFNLVRRWEDIPPYQIRDLFSLYLYPILNWSRKEKTKPFTRKNTDAFEGVNADWTYTYAERTKKAMPCFQINEPFIAGGDFFRMVEHYIVLLADLKREIDKIIDGWKVFQGDIAGQYSSTGFRYALNLFYCAALFYFDRFHSLDEMAVKKLFAWAMMIRVDMKKLGFDTVNNYAVGNTDDNYRTNSIPMFFRIATARSSRDISDLRIAVKRANDCAGAEGWNTLYDSLKKLMGV